MIYYNAKLLNTLLEKFQNEGNKKLVEALQYISPIAWINMNLYGFYSFEDDDPTTIDMKTLAESINMMKSV